MTAIFLIVSAVKCCGGMSINVDGASGLIRFGIAQILVI